MKDQRGVSLVELIIYIAIVGVMLSTIAIFLINLMQARAKTAALSEVIGAATLIQERLHDAARHAEGINTGSSTFNSDPGVLSLDMVSVSEDPVVFSLTADDGQFQVSQAGGGAVALSGSALEITNLVFTNLTSADDTGIIQVNFTVSAPSDESVEFFAYEESFQTTLRIPLVE